jgi:hypothetical protein
MFIEAISHSWSLKSPKECILSFKSGLTFYPPIYTGPLTLNEFKTILKLMEIRVSNSKTRT